MDIKEKVKALPASPGVYIMKDSSGSILDVGKAINLKKRVASYFYPGRMLSDRIDSMAAKVSNIEHISTSSEAEALIYENSLIKQLDPKYNVALKDDKGYPRLKITVNEKFPRLFITRKKIDDGALYYGPFTSAKLLRQAVIMLRQLFPLRRCLKLPKKVCLYYHIRQCPGPCAGKIDKAGYSDTVSELKLFLDGNRKGLIDHLAKRMIEASGREDFEEAGRLKLRIETLSSINDKTVSYKPIEEVEELKSFLGIKTPIDTIEAFDVSNIMGESAVGSMVSFHKGKSRKSEYRKFKINSVTGIDDYSMMREIVSRRYKRLIDEKKDLPDLILIDGGKGHLAAASEELNKLGLADIPVIGIAKEFEHIYSKSGGEPIILPRDSKSLHLLERIRDEAHRFAIGYHKRLRSKDIKISELDGIGGIGPKKKAILIKHFGSVKEIKRSDAEKLSGIKGIDERTAKRIIEYFKK